MYKTERSSNRTRQKKKTGDSNMELNDSLEILDGGGVGRMRERERHQIYPASLRGVVCKGKSVSGPTLL